jgi:hypothetical protein
LVRYLDNELELEGHYESTNDDYEHNTVSNREKREGKKLERSDRRSIIAREPKEDFYNDDSDYEPISRSNRLNIGGRGSYYEATQPIKVEKRPSVYIQPLERNYRSATKLVPSETSGALSNFNNVEFILLYDLDADPDVKVKILKKLYDIFIWYLEGEYVSLEEFCLMLADEGYIETEYELQKILAKVAKNYKRGSFDKYTKDPDYYTQFSDTFGVGVTKLLDLYMKENLDDEMMEDDNYDADYLNLPFEYYISIIKSIDVMEDVKISILEELSELSDVERDDVPFIISVSKLREVLDNNYLSPDQVDVILATLRSLS